MIISVIPILTLSRGTALQPLDWQNLPVRLEHRCHHLGAGYGVKELLRVKVMAKAECLLPVLPLTSSGFPLTPASNSTLEFCMTKSIASNWKVRAPFGVGEGLFQKIA
jgi:hypothetical protein